MAAIELKNKTPLIPANLDKDDRIMIIDQNDTVVEVTTLQNLITFLDSCGFVTDPELTTALLTKADVNHTHTIAQVDGLQDSLTTFQTFLDNSGIVGETIFIGGQSIVVNQGGTGGGGTVNANDPRLPDNVGVGNYLRISATDGTLEQVTIDQLKVDLSIENVDNTSDANKPVSILTQVEVDRLDERIDNLDFGDGTTDLTAVSNADSVEITSSTGDNATISQASTTSAGVMSNVDKSHLDSIEENADVTDTENVHQALGITSTGATDSVLSQRGVFVPQLGGGTINITGNNLNVQLTELNQLVPPLAIAVVDNDTAYLNTTDAAISANINSAFPSSAWLELAGGGGGGAVLMTATLQEVPAGGIAVIDFNNQYYNTGDDIIMANTSTSFSSSPWIKVGRDQLAFTQENTQIFGLGGLRTNVARVGAQNKRARLEIENASSIPSSFTWNFDPDTSNTVYTQSFSETPTGIGSQNEALISIATEISQDPNFSWDGEVRDCYIDEGTSFDGEPYQGWGYDRYTLDFPNESAGWSRYSGNVGSALFTIPNIKEGTVAGAIVGVIPLHTLSIADASHWFGIDTPLSVHVYREGDVVRFSFPSGAAGIFRVIEEGQASGEGQWMRFETVLIEDSRLVGDDLTLTAQILTGTRCIEIDLGTPEDITSSFSIPGIQTNLVEIDGDLGGGTASLVEVSYGGTVIGSFESFATDTEQDNRDEVGVSIASIINGSIQSPNDYYAIYNPSTKTVSAFSRFGDLDVNLFSVSINNQNQVSNPGDITVSVSSFGRDFALLDQVVLSQEVYVDGLPTADPNIEGRVWNDNGTLKVSGETVVELRLSNIEIDELNFIGTGEIANVVVSGVSGTQFNLSVVSTTPTGWLTAGALGAMSGTIPADGTFETTLTIPSTTNTVDRTAAIRAINSTDATNIVTTGLFRQTHTAAVSDGDLTASSDSVTVGTVVTFSATITAGDPSFIVSLYDTDPSIGTPTPLQTATLTGIGTHTFTGIDTADFEVGQHDYWIRVSDSDGDIVIEMESISVTTTESEGIDVFESYDDEYGIRTTGSNKQLAIGFKNDTGLDDDDITLEVSGDVEGTSVLSSSGTLSEWGGFLVTGLNVGSSSSVTLTLMNTSVSPNSVLSTRDLEIINNPTSLTNETFFGFFSSGSDFFIPWSANTSSPTINVEVYSGHFTDVSAETPYYSENSINTSSGIRVNVGNFSGSSITSGDNTLAVWYQGQDKVLYTFTTT